MEAVVYLIRSPLETISPFLYSEVDNAIVIGLENTPLAGKVLKSVAGCPWEKDVVLSDSELLEVLIKSQRVIAL